MEKSHWPWCLHWHGWLPLLSSVNGASPWAATAGEAAVNMLECTLSAYTAQVLGDWELPDGVDWDAAVGWLPADLVVGTDGSLISEEISGAASAGSGVYARLCVDVWENRKWEHVDDLVPTLGGSVASCTGFCSLPGPL